MIVRRTLPSTLCVFALFASQAALAQRAVILQFEGDKSDKIRTQVVRALKDSEIELVPIKEHIRVATKKGFKGSKLMGPEAVATTAKELKFVVALEGAVTDTLFVRILDASGNELWSKEGLPLKRGELSEKNAGRLAKALIVAAKAQSGLPPVVEKKEPAEEEEETPEPPAETEKPKVTEEEEEKPKQEETPMPGLDLTGPSETPEQREQRMREEAQESHTATGRDATRESGRDEDLEGEARRRKKGGHVGPKLVRITLGLTTTWRSYCSRPGVKTCAEFDAKPEEERPASADTVDFSPQAPYLGFGLGLEFFPLASFDNPANGLGLSASFSRGFSRVNVRVTQGDVQLPPQTIISIDDEWHVFAHYRFHFGLGSTRDPLVGYVGAKGGIAARTFEIDPNATVPLPGSHRRYPAVGLELSVPILKFFRLEASGMYFPTISAEWSPGAGPDEQIAYGTSNKPFGWMAEAGVAGELWGPLGYSAKFRLHSFKDEFSGQGNKWNDGGVAEETYTGLFFGASAAF